MLRWFAALKTSCWGEDTIQPVAKGACSEEDMWRTLQAMADMIVPCSVCLNIHTRNLLPVACVHPTHHLCPPHPLRPGSPWPSLSSLPLPRPDTAAPRESAGMGGPLNEDEFNVILGALDLTSKVALKAMTPLDKVVMLSTHDQLDK